MKDSERSKLEHDLRHAFEVLADGKLSDPIPDVSGGELSSRRRTYRPMAAVAAIVGVVAIVGAAIALAGGGGGSRTRIHSAGAPRSRIETSTGRVESPTGVGSEVPLASASGPDVEFLTNYANRSGGLVPGSTPVAVAPYGRPGVVVVYKGADTASAAGCVTIANAPNSAAGYQGSCTPAGASATTLLATADQPEPDANTTWYLVWTKVPAGTAYVTFSYNGVEQWQRPLDGVSCFTVVAAGPTPGVALPVASAFDDAGMPLGEARVQG